MYEMFGDEAREAARKRLAPERQGRRLPGDARSCALHPVQIARDLNLRIAGAIPTTQPSEPPSDLGEHCSRVLTNLWR